MGTLPRLRNQWKQQPLLTDRNDEVYDEFGARQIHTLEELPDGRPRQQGRGRGPVAA